MGGVFTFTVLVGAFVSIGPLCILVIYHLAVLHDIGQLAEVLDSSGDNNPVGALTDRAHYLVVCTYLEICSIDYDTTALLALGWRLGKAATLHPKN